MRPASALVSCEIVARDLRHHLDIRQGSRKRLARRLGLTRQALYNRLHGGLTFADLCQALDVVRLDPLEFFHGVARRFHPELLLHELRTASPKPVYRFRQSLALAPGRRYSPDEVAEIAGGLEELRFRDPKGARLRALDVLRTPDLPDDEAAEAFGVYGVVERYRGRTAITGYCYDEALRCHPSPAVRARTLQRFFMLALFNAGDPELARKALLRSRELYAAVGDLSGQGKTYVDEAVIHSHCGDHRRAYAAEQAALRLLDGEERINRVAAYQGLAISAAFLGDVPTAYRHLDQATLVSDGPNFWIVWCRGELALVVGEYQKAIEHFLAAWDTVLDLELGPLEETLISLRIAKAYFLQGDEQHLQAVLRDVLEHHPEVERANPVLGAALGEFLRSSARGRLTADLLEEIFRKMRGGTQTTPPLLPSILPPS